ncbi:insulinase family protein [Candidatus Riflebacteria bacterium]
MKKLLISFFCITLLFSTDVLNARRNRPHRLLVLANGLGVRLVNDIKVHRSAAALSVGAGSMADPGETSGLAHYLEHMLFMGTKKYPRVEDYKEYLSKNSGYSNAYTAMDETNYFFEVSHKAFEGALDRFSQFFIAPLFNRKYVDKERHAVDSEHQKNLKHDYWRMRQIIRGLSPADHPASYFSTGDINTLAGDNLPRLKKFHKDYYAAANMKLCILSSLSLDKQEELVRKYFAQIPGYDAKKLNISPDFRPALKDEYRLLLIEPVKDLKILRLQFPTIEFDKYHSSHPGRVLGFLFGHEGRGSLLSLLKKEGLALGLSAGGHSESRFVNTFDVTITLTEKGLGNINRVLECFFSYAKMLKKHGVSKYTFEEEKKMAQINYDWRDPTEGGDFVSRFSSLMQDYPLSEVATAPFLIQQYDKDAYTKVLDTIVPKNMLAVVQAKEKVFFKALGENPENARLDGYKTEKFYKARYKYILMGGEEIKKLNNPPQLKELFYPEPNEFIPEKLALHKDKPVLLHSDSSGRLWFQKDQDLKQPKLYFKTLIHTQKVYQSAKNVVLANLYSFAINEALNEQLYPMQVAGLSASVSNQKEGVVLLVSGYSSRIFDLFKRLVRSLKTIEISKEKFENARDFMKNSLKNARFSQAYHRVGYYSELLLYKKHFGEEERIRALEKIKFEDLKEFVRTLYDSTFVQSIAYGNGRSEQLLNAYKYLLLHLNSTPLPPDFRHQPEITQLNNMERVVFTVESPGNNALIKKEFQMGEATINRRALQRLVFKALHTDFYKQMRTEQQLGYIVFSYEIAMYKTLFGILVVQSGKYPAAELKRRVDAWASTQDTRFSKISNAEIEKYKSSIILSLSKKAESINEMGERLYFFMTRQKEDFDFYDKQIEAVKRAKKEDIIDFAKELFSSKKTPVLDILIRAKGHPPIKGMTSAKEFKKNRKFR